MTNRRLSSKALAQDLWESSNVNISARSVRRRLLKANLKSHRPAKKPFINAQQRARRVRWCLEHREWTLDQWRKVIFTDESKFQLFNTKQMVRRRPGERFNPECIAPTVKFPDSVMVWSCMCYHGVGRMFLLEKNEKFNAKTYQNVIQSRLLPSALEWHPDGSYIFQDDGAPCHRARSVLALKDQLNVPSLDWWPGQSPDLNVIENLWSRVDNLLRERPPTTRNELIGSIIRIWNHVITPDEVHNLVDSMPDELRQ